MVELIDDNHIERVSFELVDAVRERLHRGEDMAALVRALTAHKTLTERRLTEYKLEHLLGLSEDLVSMCDK